MQPLPATPASAASLSPPAMPRLSFFLRSPPRVVSPPVDPAALLFAGDVWVPAEPSFLPFGLGAKWTKTPLALWTAPVVDAARPLLHVRLGGRVAVVAAVHTPTPTKDCKTNKTQDKKEIVLDAKAPDDVRRAVLYHTAAVSAPLAFFVDADFEREHLLALLRRSLAPSPPHAIRPPSPSAPPAAAPSLDAAFALLQDARAKQQRGHVVDALTAFASADRALAAVESTPTLDSNTRGRVSQARREARAAIDALEMEKALPRTIPSLVQAAGDSTPPLQTPSVAPPPTSIDSRLEHLQAFAHQRDVDRAQRERRVAPDDLTLRLHALSNDKPTAPSMESLRSRLNRLRGGDVVVTHTPSMSPVDRIVQQAMDEVALGINDDEEQELDDGDETASSCSSRSNEEDESSWRRR